MLALSVAVAGGALVGLGAPAGAGVTDSVSCDFALSATSLAGPGTVTVSGTAPGSTEVHIFLVVNGVSTEVPGSPVLSTPVTGLWGPVQVSIAETSDIRVSLDPSYGETPCVGPGSINVARPAAAALPRTGSNNTEQFVVAALVLIAIGAVLVVGAKRRREAHSRV